MRKSLYVLVAAALVTGALTTEWPHAARAIEPAASIDVASMQAAIDARTLPVLDIERLF
jgi:hypothetical protein